MEILDIVNEKDEVVGQAERKEAYAKLLPHRIVHVLIFNKEGEMALQLRSKNVSFLPNAWSTAVGGHVRSGESYEEATSREYQEELGVKSELEFFSKDFYEVSNVPKKFVVVYKTNFNGVFKIESEDVEKADFFSIEEIKQMIKNGEKFHPELLFIFKKYFNC